MDGIIGLTDVQRTSALEHFRFSANSRMSRRDHALLLLDRGWSYRAILDAMLCGSNLLSEVKQMLLEGGLECALGLSERATSEPELSDTVYTWVVNSTPQDVGYFRTR